MTARFKPSALAIAGRSARRPEALVARAVPLEPADAVGDAVPGPLERLRERMRLRSDFPALSSALSTINRMAGSETAMPARSPTSFSRISR